ncbi:dehydratase [Rubrobacter marinus]|uniref:Dehydratase n=1 Tax=Rubrobacter marinus TaxID=2653852 RepID=A0A6G8PZX6_9ACTN|nr:MaoC family dehydratase [Rubrobacter marinus]QIN79771.1 dehydratase [Rubrobacter marinus]
MALDGDVAGGHELYFEDFEEGQVFELGERTLTKEEIIAFAREYDPQPFHVDEEAAGASAFGGLIASGWHTAAVFMRLYVDAVLHRAASLGSPGVEELRWLRPVRPGDALSARLTVLEAAASSTNPARGTVYFVSEVHNGRGEKVMTMKARGLFARRGGSDGPPRGGRKTA